MLKVFKGVTNFYGNNTVYLTDGKQRVQRLEKHNYDITAMTNNGDEMWMTIGVIVALGADFNLREAAKELKVILRRIEADAAKLPNDEECSNCGSELKPRKHPKLEPGA